jgi:hypothetical protein
LAAEDFRLVVAEDFAAVVAVAGIINRSFVNSPSDEAPNCFGFEPSIAGNDVVWEEYDA